MSIGGVGGYAAFGYLEFGSVGSRSELGQRMMMLLRFESGTWRKGLYGSQPKGVRASIDKKAGKLQNYRSVCRSVDRRGSGGAAWRWAAAQFRVLSGSIDSDSTIWQTVHIARKTECRPNRAFWQTEPRDHRPATIALEEHSWWRRRDR